MMDVLGEERSRLVFLVDDEERNLFLFKKALSSQGYDLMTFTDGSEVVARLMSGVVPDLVVTDVMMPRMDGYSLTTILKADPRTRSVPVIMVTGLEDIREKVRGLESGADDFVTKPFHPMELKARVRSLMRIKALHDELEHKNVLLEDEKALLEDQVRERTTELEGLTIGIVAAFEKANAMKDSDTGMHIQRVCSYSHVLALQMGMDRAFSGKIRRYASLHDVGKVGIPDQILKKQGSLTSDEWSEMKRHTVYGYDLLGLACADEMARNIALSHHERWNGSGYPDGLKGDKIPIEARIVALADVYDALTTKRCYKDAFPSEEAERTIREETDAHFDPSVVDAMFGAIGSFNAIREKYADPFFNPAVAYIP